MNTDYILSVSLKLYLHFFANNLELKKGFINTIYHQFIIHSTFFFFNDYFSFTKMNVVIISFIFFCLSTPSKSQHIHIILFSFFFAYISSIIFSLLCYSVYS